MRFNFARIYFALVCAVPAVPLAAVGQGLKQPAIVSTSQISLNGGGLPGESLSLPVVHGDWFATEKDAHANLDLESAPGPTRITLQMQWDGKAATQTINADNNSTSTGAGRSTFYVMVSKDGRSDAASPRHDDAVTLTITRMDESTLEARLSGTVTGDGPIQLQGTISLRRAGTRKMLASGTYRDCDPTVYEKMVGAEDRSASECESKFDAHVRETLLQAFAPVVSGLTAGSWTVDKSPKMGPVTQMARHTESKPYQLNSTFQGAFAMELALSPDSPAFQRTMQAYQEAMDKMKQQVADQMKNGGARNPQAAQQMAQSIAALADNSKIRISVVINFGSIGVVNFKGAHTVDPLPGGGSVVFVPGAQPSTGGGPDAGEAMTWVLLGSWATVQSRSLGADGEHLDVKGGMSPAKPPLAVQNVWVRIRTSKELAAQVIAKTDWEKIRGLVTE